MAPRLSNLTKDDLFKILGEPETDCVTRTDGKPLDCGVPTQIVQSAKWPGWPDADMESGDEEDNVGNDVDDDIDLEEIRLLDLGEAFLIGSESTRVAQPGGLQAPETIFANSLSYKIDLWRAGLVVWIPDGCTSSSIYELIPLQIHYLTFGVMPFQWHGIDTLAASMISFTGHLPQEWREKWADLRRGSKNKFVLSISENGHVPEPRSKQKSASREDDAERALVVCVIEGLMRLSPSDRMSASQALHSLRCAEQTEIGSLL